MNLTDTLTRSPRRARPETEAEMRACAAPARRGWSELQYKLARFSALAGMGARR